MPKIKCIMDDQISGQFFDRYPMLFERLECYKSLDHRRIKMFLYLTLCCAPRGKVYHLLFAD